MPGGSGGGSGRGVREQLASLLGPPALTWGPQSQTDQIPTEERQRRPPVSSVALAGTLVCYCCVTLDGSLSPSEPPLPHP